MILYVPEKIGIEHHGVHSTIYKAALGQKELPRELEIIDNHLDVLIIKCVSYHEKRVHLMWKGHNIEITPMAIYPVLTHGEIKNGMARGKFVFAQGLNRLVYLLPVGSAEHAAALRTTELINQENPEWIEDSFYVHKQTSHIYYLISGYMGRNYYIVHHGKTFSVETLSPEDENELRQINYFHSHRLAQLFSIQMKSNPRDLQNWILRQHIPEIPEHLL